MTSQGREFQRELFARFESALAHGDDWVEVNCRDLHDTVQEDLGFDTNRHSTCSGVMWRETAAGNCQVVSAPPLGNGPALTIRYGLPRDPFTPLLGEKREFAEGAVSQLPSVLGKGRVLGRGLALLRLETDREIHNFALTEEQARHLAGRLHYWANP